MHLEEILEVIFTLITFPVQEPISNTWEHGEISEGQGCKTAPVTHVQMSLDQQYSSII